MLFPCFQEDMLANEKKSHNLKYILLLSTAEDNSSGSSASGRRAYTELGTMQEWAANHMR